MFGSCNFEYFIQRVDFINPSVIMVAHIYPVVTCLGGKNTHSGHGGGGERLGLYLYNLSSIPIYKYV